MDHIEIRQRIKFKFGNDMRRVSMLKSELQFTLLIKLVKEIYQINNEKLIQLTYTDPENDSISICSDVELAEAISVGVNNTNNTLVISVNVLENQLPTNKDSNLPPSTLPPSTLPSSTNATQPHWLSRNLHFVALFLFYHSFTFWGLIVLMIWLYRNRYLSHPRSLAEQIDGFFDWLKANWDSVNAELNQTESTPKKDFSQQLKQLEEMGLKDRQKNLEVLNLTGSLSEAIELLSEH